MKCRAKHFFQYLLLMFFFLLLLKAGGIAGVVTFYGKSADVDLADLESYEGERLDETGIRIICSEIISRYHDMGYTAFYIKKAVYTRDGRLEIFFNESVVSEIQSDNDDPGSAELAGEVYRKGDVFNEFLLRNNISALKEKYTLTQLSVDILRMDDGSILLAVRSVKKRYSLSLSASGDPLHGMVPSITAGYTGDRVCPEIMFCSSLGQEKITFTESALSLSDIRSRSGMKGSAWLTLREDALDRSASETYKARSAEARGGWYIKKNAFFSEILASYYVVRTEDYYPGDGAEKYSIIARGGYDDRKLSLDRNDYTSIFLELGSGWNTLEKNMFFKSLLSARVSIPVTSGLYCLLLGEAFYTTEGYSLFGNYVFSGLLSCRKNDYTVSSSVHSAGIGITVEIMKDHIFLTPGIYGGIFKESGGSFSKPACAGAKLEWDAGKICADFSVVRDLSGSGDIVYMVSAEGRF